MAAWEVPLPSGARVTYVDPTFDAYLATGGAVGDDTVRACLRTVHGEPHSWTAADHDSCPLKLSDLAALKVHIARTIGVSGDRADAVRLLTRDDAVGRWVPLASTLTREAVDGPYTDAGTWVLIREPRYPDLRRARDIAGADVATDVEIAGYRTTAELLRMSITHKREGDQRTAVEAIDLQEWPWEVADMIPLFNQIDDMTSPTPAEIVEMGNARARIERA